MQVAERQDWRNEADGAHGAVSAGHEDAAAANIAMLEAGGDAYDAIVAAAFACFLRGRTRPIRHRRLCKAVGLRR